MDRINEIASRISQWQAKSYSNPYKLDIFITNRCNLKCRFCQFPLLEKKYYKNEMSKSKLLEIIDSAAKLDIKIVGILGGEPFIRNDVIINVMESIKENKMDGSLVTNGTLLSKNNIKRIIKMQWNLIRFSLDSSNEEIHDSLRSKSFKMIIKNLKTFQELKKIYNSDFPTIEINTVLCKKNIYDLPEIIKLAKKFKINNIYFLPMIEFKENIEDLKFQEKDIPSIARNIKLAKETSKKYNINTNLESIEKDSLFNKSNRMNDVILEGKEKNNFIPCYLPWYGINISTNGIVTPCAAASGNAELSCGNINNSSLREIWTNHIFKKLRINMKKKKLPEICSKCCVPLLDENRQIREALAAK